MHNFFLQKNFFFRSVQPQNDGLFIWSPIATRRFIFPYENPLDVILAQKYIQIVMQIDL